MKVSFRTYPGGSTGELWRAVAKGSAGCTGVEVALDPGGLPIDDKSLVELEDVSEFPLYGCGVNAFSQARSSTPVPSLRLSVVALKRNTSRMDPWGTPPNT